MSRRFFQVIEADARSAFIIASFGEAAVFDAADDAVAVVVDRDVDVYKRRLGIADTMFECVLDKGDKEERCHFYVRVFFCRQAYRKIGVGGKTQAHEFDIIVDEVYFFR